MKKKTKKKKQRTGTCRALMQAKDPPQGWCVIFRGQIYTELQGYLESDKREHANYQHVNILDHNQHSGPKSTSWAKVNIISQSQHPGPKSTLWAKVNILGAWHSARQLWAQVRRVVLEAAAQVPPRPQNPHPEPVNPNPNLEA